MNLRVHLLAAACVLACASLVAYKVGVLGYGLSAEPSENRWNVQVTVRAEGRGERARVHLALPSGALVANVYDEQFTSPGMKLAIRAKTRLATFTSDAQRAQGPLALTYRFGARVPRGKNEKLPPPPAPEPEDSLASDTVPAAEPAVQALARELNPTAQDDLARVRGLYDFVLDEIAAGPETTGSALDALATRRAGPVARVRLVVALARALGLPARVVRSVPLAEGVSRPLLVRGEVFVDGAWVAVDPVRGRFGPEADEGFPLLRRDGELVRAEGLDDVRVEVSVAREGADAYAQHERRAREGGSVVDRFSLFHLPPRTQLVFRILLLVPLGALIVALFRNVVGVPTFGTFMPILVALAMRETRPLAGLAMLGLVVGIGLLGRRALERLRLLIVPRLSLMLTLVIFIMAGIAMVATRLDETDAFSIALLPMVIMTMTIERLSLLLEEEGPRNALKTLGGTLLVAAAGYLAIQSDALQRIVFTFPELNLLVVAALLELGRYTGYRVSELVRFRPLAREAPGTAAEPKAGTP